MRQRHEADTIKVGFPEVTCGLNGTVSEIKGADAGFVGPAWLAAMDGEITLRDATCHHLLASAPEATIRLTPSGITISVGDRVFEIKA